jgi:hypothetical protein
MGNQDRTMLGESVECRMKQISDFLSRKEDKVALPPVELVFVSV